MTITLTRYLKLKVDDSLSSDAKYNLGKIDSLGSSGIPDAMGQVNIRSVTNILLEPESPEVGGSGNGSGTIELGTPNNFASIIAHSINFKIMSALSIKNGSDNGNDTYLTLATSSDTDADCTFTISTAGENHSVTFDEDGTVTILDASQTLTNKTISGNDNTFSDISYSSLILTNSITNDDISTSASITDTKLATITTPGKVANSATTATSANVGGGIVVRDASGNFSAGTITADLVGTSTNVTGIVALSNGGTGANNASDAINALLPSQSGNQNKILKTNGSTVEWASPGTGQVQSYTTTWTSGTTKTVNHNIGTKNLLVTVRADSFDDGESLLTDVEIYVEVQAIDDNNTLLTSTEVPSGTWTVTIQGAP